MFHERTTHVEIGCHFIQEKLQEGLITLSHVKSEDQPTDVFTKSLNGVLNDKVVSNLYLRSIDRDGGVKDSVTQQLC